MINYRFGKKLKLPSTAQLKHQILVAWLADQRKKEADEAEANRRRRDLVRLH